MIGNDVVISRHVRAWYFGTHQILHENHISMLLVIIGSHVCIGTNGTILIWVTINDGIIIATGAVVAKDVQKNSMMGKFPTRVIKENIKRK